MAAPGVNAMTTGGRGGREDGGAQIPWSSGFAVIGRQWQQEAWRIQDGGCPLGTSRTTIFFIKWLENVHVKILEQFHNQVFSGHATGLQGKPLPCHDVTLQMPL